MAGRQDPHVGHFGFRTLDGCQAMIDFASNKTTAVIIGGGLLGLEVARGLQNRGLAVDVVHATPTFMNAQLDDNVGGILRRSVEALGIGVHTDKRTIKVLCDNGRLAGIEFSDGDRLSCDMLVVAVGIRPNIGLAQRAGLTVERTIVVDDHMRSVDDDDIYAVGECAQHRGQVYGLRAAVGTGDRARRPHHRRKSLRRLPRRMATKLNVAGVDVAATGLKGPEANPNMGCTRPSSCATTSSSAPPLSGTSAKSRF